MTAMKNTMMREKGKADQFINTLTVGAYLQSESVIYNKLTLANLQKESDGTSKGAST